MLDYYYYTYDAASRMTSMYSSVDGTNTFTLDNTDQLTSASLTDENYQYDANGNRSTQATRRLPATGCSRMGRIATGLRSGGNRIRKYIDNGNGVFGPGDTSITLYGWDCRNRLVDVVFKDTYAGPVTKGSSNLRYQDWQIRRAYDADGAGTQPMTYTYTVYQGDDPWIEFYDQDGLGGGTYFPSINHRYFYGPPLYGQAVDQILSVEDSAHNVLWGLPDHEGSIRDLVNAVGGPWSQVKYDSFGKLIDNSVIYHHFAFGYTGKPYDAATGLYNYRTGGTIQTPAASPAADPSGLTPDTNPYRYCGNDPYDRADPMELCGQKNEDMLSLTLAGEKPEEIGPMIPENFAEAGPDLS